MFAIEDFAAGAALMTTIRDGSATGVCRRSSNTRYTAEGKTMEAIVRPNQERREACREREGGSDQRILALFRVLRERDGIPSIVRFLGIRLVPCDVSGCFVTLLTFVKLVKLVKLVNFCIVVNLLKTPLCPVNLLNSSFIK